MSQRQHVPRIFITALFLLWLFVFRGFLDGDLALKDDAVSYYDHTKFYIDNLATGIYPMWDPTWNAGVPNEFFLRRIGSFNPVYPLLAVLQRFVLPPTQTYLVFISVYFFLGALGYYLLLRRILKEPLIACTGLALLIFSSFSFVLFGSFIILIFTPAVWFLYFLFSFIEEQERKYFLGICFSLMIVMTTYIPFYFMTIILTLLILCALGHYSRLPAIVRGTGTFIQMHRMFAALCLLLVGLSLVPGCQLFQGAKKDAFVLPSRHVNASTDNVFGVDQQPMHVGAVVNPGLLVKELFIDLQQIDLDRTYLPFFIYVLLLLGSITAIRRNDLAVFLWGLFFFLLSLKEAAPIYGFLYAHIFFFKYFRNLQFFFLLTFYPCLIWLAVSFLKQFLENVRPAWLGSKAATVIIFAAVTLHPLWVYSHVADHAAKKVGASTYEKPYRPFAYLRGAPRSIDLDRPRQTGAPDYYATSWFAALKGLIDHDILQNYLNHKFVIYDGTVHIPDERIEAKDIERIFYYRTDQALVEAPVPEQKIAAGGPQAIFVDGPSENFRVTDFDANSIRIKANFPTKKFVVYNDSYHPDWQVSVDGQNVPMVRSNMAFKGWWVPAGERTIRLRFGSAKVYVWNYFYMFVFSFTLASLLILCWKEKTL